MSGDLKTPVLEAARQYRDEERAALSRVVAKMGDTAADHAILGVTNAVTWTQASWILLTERFISYAEDERQTVDSDAEVGELIETAFESCLRSWTHLASSFIQARLLLRSRVLGLTPNPPLLYTTEEIAQIARYSRDEYLRKVEEAKVGDPCIEDQDELRDTQQFWRTIAADYEAIGMMAEGGKLEQLIRYYNGLDTADRDNFGWGADIWDEDRWYATLHQGQ